MASVYKRKGTKRRKGAKWMVSWYDAEQGLWRDRVGYTDKDAALSLGQRLEREAADRAEGISNPFDEQRKRAIGEHLADFISKTRSAGRDDAYVNQLETRIKRVIYGTGAKRLHELDPVRIDRFLDGLRHRERPLSGRTRNEYVTSTKSFTKWAVEAGRIVADPLVGLKRRERRSVKHTHPRRALKPTEITKLLDAAQRRPRRELLMIRTGPNKGELLADVSKEALAKAGETGRQRRLAYMLAVWTGLRRSEIAALCWGDIELDTAVARIHLRAETTKSRRADSVVIHPQLAEELRAVRPERASSKTPVVNHVPSIRVMDADLKLAGIDRGDGTSGIVDFHALRKTLGTMMAAAGMSQRARQAHMRHTDPRLTESTYMDENLLPIAAELSQLPPIPRRDDDEAGAIPLRANGTTDSAVAEQPSQRAGNMQETSGTKGHRPPSRDMDDESDETRMVAHHRHAQVRSVSRLATKEQDLSPSGNRSSDKAGDGIRTHDIHVGKLRAPFGSVA
jgi:integrase